MSVWGSRWEGQTLLLREQVHLSVPKVHVTHVCGRQDGQEQANVILGQ